MAQKQDRSLARIRLLAALPPEVRTQLEGMCQWHRLGRGEEIVSQQDEGNHVFLITRGSVRVVIHAASGREVAFVDLVEGDHFGEVAAIDGGARSASVVGREPTTLARLSASLFLDLCRRYPDLAITVMRELTAVVRRLSERVVTLSTLGAHNRVHAELLRLARASDGESGKERTIRPLPRHGEIAAQVSTSRETVARVMADLERRDLIRRDRGRLVIADLERLEGMVERVQID